MNKKILILVVLIVVAGVYWLSTMNPADYGTPNEEAVNNTPENEVDIDSKGPIGVATDGDKQYLVDRNGMTLYANIKDQNPSGKVTPNCNAACEKTWLPYLLGAEEVGITESTDPVLSKLNLFLRADGKTQYTIGTTPLYRYIGDTKTGDVTGDLTGDWMVALP